MEVKLNVWVKIESAFDGAKTPSAQDMALSAKCAILNAILRAERNGFEHGLMFDTVIELIDIAVAK